MRILAFCAVLSLAIGSFATDLQSAPEAVPAKPAAKQFVAKFVVSETVGGKRKIVAEPTIIANDGQEATFLSGGEVPVGDGTNDALTFGLRTRIKVHEVASDKLRVSMYAGQSDLERGEGDFLIRESGVHCVRTVKPGETIELAIGAGWKAAVTISAVEK